MRPLNFAFRGSAALALLTILSCSPALQHSVSSGGIIAIDSASVPFADSLVTRMITPYHDSMEVTMGVLVCRSETAMTKGNPESALGNFVSDLVYERAAEFTRTSGGPIPDFCLLNNGGLRSPLPAGDILLRNVYELMPFDNEIVIVTINGSTLYRLLDYISSRKGAPVSHLRMSIENNSWKDVLINDQPLDTTRSYQVVTSDYLAGGGDEMGFFTTAKRLQTGIKIRDAIVDYMVRENHSGRTIKGQTDGRITIR